MPQLTTNELKDYTVYNTKWNESARTVLAETDLTAFAGSNLTFPIVDNQDVKLALNLAKYADDPTSVVSNIVSIAKEKGLDLPQRSETATGITPPVSNQGDTMTREEARVLALNCKDKNTRNALLSFANNKPTVNSPMKAPESMSDDELQDHHKRVASEVLKRHHGMAGDYNGKEDDDDDDDAKEGSEDEGEGSLVASDREMHSFDDGPVDAGEKQAGGKGTKDEYPPNVDDMPNRNQKKGVLNMKQEIARLKSMGVSQQLTDILINALQMDHEQKFALVKRIVSNVKDQTQRNALGNKLMGWSIGQIREVYLPLLANQQRQATPEPQPLYFGANPPVQNNAGTGGVEVPADDPMVRNKSQEYVTANANKRLLYAVKNGVTGASIPTNLDN